MKTTGRCPKCGSADLLAVEPGLIRKKFLKWQDVCRSCGYTEEWIAQESMEKLRQSTWHDEK